MHAGLFEDWAHLVEEQESQHLRERMESKHLKERNEVNLPSTVPTSPALREQLLSKPSLGWQT